MRRPVDAPLTQDFGSGATAGVAANPSPNSGMGYYVYLYGNYQPDGHTGQDYGAASGSPVYAVTSGKVLHVGRLSGTYASNPWWILPSFFGYGYVIDHGAFIGIYGHCLDGGSRVSVGEWVKEGQVIGLSGSTGASVWPHLHFEILRDGYVLNSRYYGRSNPEELFEGTVTTSGNITPSTPKEDTLSAEEVREIKDHINAVMIGGYTWGDERRPGVASIVTENQRRIDAGNAKLDGITSIIVPGERGKRDAGPLFGLLATMRGENAGLLAALRATGSGQPVDLEEVKAASREGAAEALAELQATATTTITLSQEG